MILTVVAVLAQLALWLSPFLLVPLAGAVYFRFGGRL